MKYRCHNCGGELAFDPASQKLKCPYCDSEFELDAYESHDHTHEHEHEHVHEAVQPSGQEDGLAVYTCSQCGAEIVTQENTLSTNCLYCGNPLVFSHTQSNENAPTHVLPFMVDKKELKEIYEEYVKDKPFVPDVYMSSNVIDKIQPIYVPFWLFDMEMEGTGLIEGERTSSYIDGDYRITEHDVFQYPVQSYAQYRMIPVDASKKTPNDAMDSIEPFDLSKMEPFKTGYLTGFKAEQYDEDARTCQERAHNRAANSTEVLMSNESQGLVGEHLISADTTLKSANARYVLLPTYLMYTNPDIARQFHAETNPEILQAKDLIAVNGQTGKVAANIPVDQGKRNKYFAKTFAICLVPSVMISLLLVACFFRWVWL